MDASTTDLEALLSAIQRHGVTAPEAGTCLWSADGDPPGPSHYANRDGALGIDFQVERLPFSCLQVMDPRLVRIAPGACNEKHRHAHESIFVVLSGTGELQIGSSALPLATGSVACVPRWVVHQSRNTSAEADLLLLAITDFGLTSAVLGNYDARTRLRQAGEDAFVEAPPS